MGPHIYANSFLTQVQAPTLKTGTTYKKHTYHVSFMPKRVEVGVGAGKPQ